MARSTELVYTNIPRAREIDMAQAGALMAAEIAEQPQVLQRLLT